MEIMIVILIIFLVVVINFLVFVYLELRSLNKKFETLFEAFVNIGNGMGVLNNNIIEMLKTCNYCTVYCNTLAKDEKIN